MPPTPGRLSGFSGTSFDNMLLDAGAIILNPADTDYDTLVAAAAGDEDAGTKFGATTGGITFEDEIESGNLAEDIDGLTVDLRGALVIEKISATLSTSAYEMTPGNIKAIKPYVDVVENVNGTIDYMPRTYLIDDDYIDLVAFMLQGRVANTQYPLKIAVFLKNVLALEGGGLASGSTASEKTSVEVTWTAMSDEGDLDPESGSYRPGYWWTDYSELVRQVITAPTE